METDFIFLVSKITVGGDCSHEIKRCLLLGRKAMTNLEIIFKKQRHHIVDKGLYGQSYVFFPVVMYGCESWTIKKAEHQRTAAFKLCLQKTLETLLNWKEIKPVHPKGNQPWIFIGRTDAEVKALIFWLPDEKSQFTGENCFWERLRAGREADDPGSTVLKPFDLEQFVWLPVSAFSS